MVKFLDLRNQYEGIKAEIDDAMTSVIRDSAFIGGPYVRNFEDRFAYYHQVRHCVGVGNGTDALEIALEALALPPGSEVLVPATGFIATSEAVTRAGHRVVFCDCEPRHYTISVRDAQRRLTPATRALIAVHLYGHPCDMEEVLSFSRANGLKVLEDCAQAHGAECRGRKVGGFGDVGTFSFYPGKNLGAYGDGGAIVTDDEGIARKCRMISNHGRVDKYDHEFEGRNSRLDGLQAAILDVKLRHLDGWIARRRVVASYYNERLRSIPGVTIPESADWARPVYHLYVLRTPARDLLKKYLADNGVQTGIHYPSSLPRLPAYLHLGQQGEPMFSNICDRQLLSLPMGEHLGEPETRKVAGLITEYFSRNPA